MAEELQVETSRVLKHECHLKPNITWEEARALEEVKQEKSRVILAADKGVTVVVLDKQEYINKAQDLLAQGTHKDPDNKDKNKLINMLRTTKEEGVIGDNTYQRLYPACTGLPKFNGVSKIHKKDTQAHCFQHGFRYIWSGLGVG